MDWLEIAVAADDEAVEAVAEVLRSHGRGVAIDEPFIQPHLEDPPRRDPTRRPVVKTYLPDDSAAGEAQRRIEHALWHIAQLRAVEPMGVRRIAEEDWANAWKAFFPVLRVGNRTVIVPPWRRYRRQHRDTGHGTVRGEALAEVIVRLDPGRAFGTGTHPTTRLCLQAVEALVRPGARVLDVGTGSGILAIAAARLGAAHVMALDIDPIAVKAARDNVRRNRVSRIVKVFLGSPDGLTPSGPIHDPPAVSPRGDADEATPALGQFDLILANITARTNASLAASLLPRLAPGGRLVASGILVESAHLVTEAYATLGLDIVGREVDGDWLALVAAPRAERA